MSSVNYSQLIPNSANLSWFSASSRVGDAVGIAPLWEGKRHLEYLQAEQRDWDAGAFEDAVRGASAGGSLPFPQPQLQPEADARRG